MCPGMSLAASITIADSAAANKTFVTIAPPPGATGTVRIDNTTTLAAPRLMTIKHTSAKEGDTVMDRHLLSFSVQKLNALGKPAKPVIVNFTVAIPRDSTYNSTDTNDLVAFLKNELAVSGLVTSLLLGES